MLHPWSFERAPSAPNEQHRWRCTFQHRPVTARSSREGTNVAHSLNNSIRHAWRTGASQYRLLTLLTLRCCRELCTRVEIGVVEIQKSARLEPTWSRLKPPSSPSEPPWGLDLGPSESPLSPSQAASVPTLRVSEPRRSNQLLNPAELPYVWRPWPLSREAR